ncbi:hypothetical protein GCM10023351_01490 [Microbacterium gilvum]|uniref:Uncharacterized protein n=2 Tax=Microbacterium gilvum TaxID=1336204 RepID=A0ABP8ZQ57_9MICO
MSMHGFAMVDAGLRRIYANLHSFKIVSSEPVWLGMHVALAGAGNVAKALWGSGGKKSAKRLVLRESLGVKEDSPLQDTDLRNHIEHFDERLERWWESAERNHFVDGFIGAKDQMQGASGQDLFRMYDPEIATAYFWDEAFPLADVQKEVSRLQVRALTESRKRDVTF